MIDVLKAKVNKQKLLFKLSENVLVSCCVSFSLVMHVQNLCVCVFMCVACLLQEKERNRISAFVNTFSHSDLTVTPKAHFRAGLRESSYPFL